MEEKELSQKQQAMWHQDSASSIFSDQGAGANYSGLPTDPQGRGAGGAIYSGLSPGSQDSQSRPRVVDLVRDSAGSLGISLYSGEGPGGGVYIMNLSPACQAVAKGRLNPRDRILEVRMSMSIEREREREREVDNELREGRENEFIVSLFVR